MSESKRPNLHFPDGKEFSPSKGKAWAKRFRIRSGIQPNKEALVKADRFRSREAKTGKTPPTLTPVSPQTLKNMDVTVHEVKLKHGIVMCWTSLNAIFFKKEKDGREIVSKKYTSRKYAMFYYEHNRISWKE